MCFTRLHGINAIAFPLGFEVVAYTINETILLEIQDTLYSEAVNCCENTIKYKKFKKHRLRIKLTTKCFIV